MQIGLVVNLQKFNKKYRHTTSLKFSCQSMKNWKNNIEARVFIYSLTCAPSNSSFHTAHRALSFWN